MSRRERVPATVAGIAAAALFAAGFVMIGVDAPGDETTRAEIAATYAEDGTQSRQSAGVLLVALAGCLFLPFLAGMRERLANGASTLASTGFAAGIIMAAALTVSAVLATAVSLAAGFFDAYEVRPDVALTGVAGSFYMNAFATLAGGVFVASLSVAAARAGALPRWHTRAGLAVAVVAIPGMLLGFWILVGALWIGAAALLLGRGGAIASTPGPVPGVAAQQGG